MKSVFFFLNLLFIPAVLVAQQKNDAASEIERIKQISVYQSIDYFIKASELNKTPSKGDLVVLQDEENKLYHGIIDTVRSMKSIGVILYSIGNRREIMEATFEDLFYLKSPGWKKKEGFPEDETKEIWQNLAQKEESIRKLNARLDQTIQQVEAAGRAYETSDILLYVSYGCLFIGATVGAASAFSGSSQGGSASGLFFAGWAGTGIASIVYQFKGHNRLKLAGSRRW
jgi:hypothetical protein